MPHLDPPSNLRLKQCHLITAQSPAWSRAEAPPPRTAGGVYVFARLVPLGAEIDVFVEGSSKGKDHEKLHLKNLRETVE